MSDSALYFCCYILCHSFIMLVLCFVMLAYMRTSGDIYNEYKEALTYGDDWLLQPFVDITIKDA